MDKYLEVIFHDNDFGLSIESALRRLWGFIHENNNHCLQDKASKHFGAKPLSRIFERLHRARALQPMIERLYVIEYLAFDVEYLTRGLYWRNVNWKETVIKNAGEINHKNDYLTIEIKIRNSGKFTKVLKNGQHAYLNLQTGEVGTF